MVYCRYCGAQNRDGDVKCSNCGKPLPLLPNEPHPNLRHSSGNDQNLRNNSFRDSSNNSHSIKDRYLGKNQGHKNNRNNQQNNNTNDYNQNYQNQQQDQYYQNQERQQTQRNMQNRQPQNQQTYQNQQNQQQYQQNYQDSQRYQNREYPNNLHYNEFNQQYHQNYVNESAKVSKTAIEWDVVIATALMVIILTAILQRIFPLFAIFISLLIGLAYILVATKSKSSLLKSIPLTILVILAISAYFSL